MNLSRNFTLDELLSSQYASRRNITEQFEPPQEVIDNLELLCQKVLQPIRDALGLPIVVSSGYRCKRVNEAVKGSTNSHHLKGQAADIQFPHMGNGYLFAKIKEMGIPFTQMIWEFGDSENPAWVHISYDPKNLKRQILTIK